MNNGSENFISDSFIVVYVGIGCIVFIFLVWGLLKLWIWAEKDAEKDHDL